ncbi:hypothetical protein N5K27_22590 [Pigmentiphaga sp. GD03639]|uniref:hypothetical protein n=1 Tax=Pigmentiphaga sp. GD03639 TaxID=2975354 RepID=UPI00244B71FE|nr:hypothetical protein [Pigmentiphaga sp. GD03639]MDH2239101.1 hypothetical protein [Pigmentiphaga sp. GD03639]
MADTYQAIYDAVRSRISGGDIGAAIGEAIGQQAQGLSWAIDAIRLEYVQAADAHRRAGEEMQRPSVLYRPSLSIDGDQWCALYGADLQSGVAGFGDSPAAAIAAFDTEWVKPLRARENGNG